MANANERGERKGSEEKKLMNDREDLTHSAGGGIQPTPEHRGNGRTVP